MARQRADLIKKLSRRDRRIVDHVVRFRLSTNEVLHQHFFPGQRANAVTKVTARLCQWAYLQKFPLVHPRSYLLPGPRAVQELGVPLTRTYPLGPQSLPSEYGVLAYGTRGAKLLARLTRAELKERYPFFEQAWLEAPHCWNRLREPACLELVRVDLGGAADHVARKCLADIDARMQSGLCRRLIEQRRLRLVVVTGTTDKLAAISQSLEKRVWPNSMAIHLVSLPELLPLLPHCQGPAREYHVHHRRREDH